MRFRKIITKKERAVIDQIIAAVISLLAMIILVSISMNVFIDLNNKNKMDNLARRFMLDIETIGYTGILDYDADNDLDYDEYLSLIFKREFNSSDESEDVVRNIEVTIRFFDNNGVKKEYRTIESEANYVSYGNVVEIEIKGDILSHVHSWGISGMFNIGNESDDDVWIPFSKTLASTAKR